jgi:hypothetical protein
VRQLLLQEQLLLGEVALLRFQRRHRALVERERGGVRIVWAAAASAAVFSVGRAAARRARVRIHAAPPVPARPERAVVAPSGRNGSTGKNALFDRAREVDDRVGGSFELQLQVNEG